MKKMLLGLVLAIFFGLNLFADDNQIKLDKEFEYENFIGNTAYENGDFQQAFQLFTKSCDKENEFGCNRLGIMYLKGLGVNQDYFKANELFVKSCDAGVSGACAILAQNYSSGNGVKQDYSTFAHKT